VLLDPREQRAVRANQSPKGCAAVGFDLSNQCDTFLIETPRAIRFELEKLSNTLFGRTREIGSAAAELRQVFLGQIDAAHFKIGSNVANDVGQLKREAKPFGEIGVARVAKTKDMQAGEPDGAGNSVAILGKLVEGRVGADGEVHLGAENQVMEVARRNLKARNRIGQRRKNCMAARLA